jgi:adenine deaminase
MILKHHVVDVVARRIFPAEVEVNDGRIVRITPTNETVEGFLLPGFIDAHVHVESSMLVPSEFARIAVVHGTVATISDPHEIANVLGVPGVDYMIENGKQVPFHFFFGAPSCVPATAFETAGAAIHSGAIETLLARPEIVYLAEMMNFPGVIYKDEEVLRKLAAARKHNKPVDGHAPGLRGEQMRAYFDAGITTDHECFTYAEGKEKAVHGVKIIIREGSAARNFDELIPLLNEFPEQIMFCSDDKHPDNLIEGHINQLVKRALAKGCELFDVLRAASYNVIAHYNLPVGCLQQGDAADFICVDNLENFNVQATYIRGEKVAEHGQSFIKPVEAAIVNQFDCTLKSPLDFGLPVTSEKIRVIEALEGQLVTNELHYTVKNENGFAVSDVENDVLKIVVVNRYQDVPPAVAFIKNFGLKRGAIASCVAHDCHNIVAVGVSDQDLCNVINEIIRNKGGIALADGDNIQSLALPIAGIMTNAPYTEVAHLYTALDEGAKKLGSTLRAPYMTLSFMALLVIPQLKLSDKGLFDGKVFGFTEVFVK